MFTQVRRIADSLAQISASLKLIAQSVTPGPAAKIVFITSGQIIKDDQMNLKVTEKLPLSISILDVKGNAAQVDGVPVWSLTDPSAGSLVAAADGMSAEFTPAGPVGFTKVQVSADADLGAGTVTILGELDVDLIPGDAVTINVAAGTPVPA